MKLALTLAFLILTLSPMSAHSHGNFASAITVVKANQQAKQQLRVKSSKKAAQIAKARLGGKVLKVNKRSSGYRVKLIKKDGHIVSVYVDAKTGKVSRGN